MFHKQSANHSTRMSTVNCIFAMNAISLRKILKKYDKVHCSVNGRIFKSKIRTEHIEPLQSPWLMELGAFYINFNESNGENQDIDGPFSCDLSATEPIMTLMLPESVKLEYNLTCAICLDTVYKPYALGCGHIFCKPCSCSATSVMIFQGLKTASLVVFGDEIAVYFNKPNTVR